jgi:hypothetical protein
VRVGGMHGGALACCGMRALPLTILNATPTW